MCTLMYTMVYKTATLSVGKKFDKVRTYIKKKVQTLSLNPNWQYKLEKRARHVIIKSFIFFPRKEQADYELKTSRFIFKRKGKIATLECSYNQTVE